MSSNSWKLENKWEASSSRGRSVTLLLLTFLLQIGTTLGLNGDGELLLKFKYSVLSDPMAVLNDWNFYDHTPCSWNGVVCMGFLEAAAFNWSPPANSGGGSSNVEVSMASRVIALVLPNSQLLGPVPTELGLVEHLRHLDLSGNMLNGTLPSTLFNASELRVLSLANNVISGELPDFDERTANSSLQVLNLSDNALTGRLPSNFSRLPNLAVASLSNNYLCGELPVGGFKRLQYLDLSSNLIYGSLPTELGGGRLRYLNLSYNRLTGAIPQELGARIPANATVDLSFNNLTGAIPQGGAFGAEKPMAFAGNPNLCGRPLRNPCTIPSSLSTAPPNSSNVVLQPPKSPPAFAAFPKNPDGSTPDAAEQNNASRGSLRPVAVILITVGDLAGIAILFGVFLYVYHVKRTKRQNQQEERQQQKEIGSNGLKKERPPPPPAAAATAAVTSETRVIRSLSCCLRKKSDHGDDTEETSETSESSDTDAEEDEESSKGAKEGEDGKSNHPQLKQQHAEATLVIVDGETNLEIETLLKASAYILGASTSSIVYKAVLANGTALAVRRIGESSVINKFKEFDAQVRGIAKIRHPNLLRLRGFYWGSDEKLLIHDYATNGSLANISFSKKLGSSPLHLSWEMRLRIARGVARGLAYLHEKKTLHGNVKPSNILLDCDMEAKIGDFGLDRVMAGAGPSARQFGSKRSMHSSISLPDLSSATGASPLGGCASAPGFAPPPYQAPESLKSLKPNAKWDVYAFGRVFLELIAGRVFSDLELCRWNAGFVVEERNRVVRMADAAIRGEVEGKEDTLLGCFKLGFACCAMAPQRRPSMKDVVQALENLSSSSCSYSSSSTTTT
ncbi:probable LRR receptor-like serine/threonine-protein kinase At4g37250 [Zingiber officinale]|uniref:probable LRR receptor-like serine/threonine-protein kinase At4g37250 n=1 Tax=Zingiber officinale TaxID=94328 RepID=UPI001C4AC21C|nr:probable LRR receptor-like serine/threonine-protein kinase At4g37250 [Zingiber officinale]XP_042429797.1 probable LRR receptor-like serine/threonine-protein kinase At4g37250 [Zingiber officinale]